MYFKAIIFGFGLVISLGAQAVDKVIITCDKGYTVVESLEIEYLGSVEMKEFKYDLVDVDGRRFGLQGWYLTKEPNSLRSGTPFLKHSGMESVTDDRGTFFIISDYELSYTENNMLVLKNIRGREVAESVNCTQN